MFLTIASSRQALRKQRFQEARDHDYSWYSKVAREWKSLSNSARTHWEEEARNDKIRFVQEKAAYKGPWAVTKRRAKKHPLAPKRPMSAFLKYSQTRRAKVKEDNPDMSNTDVSRLLGEMWRNASSRERSPYVEQEERERAIYKENIRKWRDDQARMDAASRTSHQTMQNYQHHSPPQPPMPQPMERPYRSGIFENLPMDSFDEPAKKPAYRHQYSSPNPAYQHYRHPYNPPADLPLHHGSELGEGDLLPLPRPNAPCEDETIGEFGNSRSTFFSDNLSLGYYSRFP
eukprot:scaffold721_cov131-Cylindrotheca_fusiformis.AAC.23